MGPEAKEFSRQADSGDSLRGSVRTRFDDGASSPRLNRAGLAQHEGANSLAKPRSAGALC
jgi:hypothetical protein